MFNKRIVHYLRREADRLLPETRGAIVMPLALLLPVLFGVSLLVIDGGRYFSLQTSLQAGADALALAGAAELDARPDSITRANRAIDNLVANDQRFGDGTASISRDLISVRFLTSLPASDAAAIANANVTTDPLKAGFVEVRVQPVTMRNLFATVAGYAGTATQTSASAVAGFDSVACNVAPLFMCNPAEDSAVSLSVLARQPSFRRRLIAMRDKGNQPGSGNYGFLVPAEGNSGATNVSNALSVDRPPGCYPKNGVEVRPGYIAATADALNVRFDIYEGGFKSSKGDPNFRPAVNVRKGFAGSGCSMSATADHIFPRDPCYATNSCTDFPVTNGSVGGGNWDFEGYWTRTFPGKPFPVDADTGETWSNANRPSRYQVYRYEIAQNLMSTPSGPGSLGAPGETGAPQCYTGDKEALKADTVDRRVFVAAILDCKAYADQMSGNSGGKIPVTSYGKFFLTEPMDKNDAAGTVWVEMIELVEPGTAAARNIIRDTVQLVR
ncbi:MAG TPA: TadE family protein [Beijerinckiaceae bacterium]|jgi:Flp pilus assembly protein TadG